MSKTENQKQELSLAEEEILAAETRRSRAESEYVVILEDKKRVTLELEDVEKKIKDTQMKSSLLLPNRGAMKVKSNSPSSWIEFLIMMILYAVVFSGISYFIFFHVEKGDQVIEFLKLVGRHDVVQDIEFPVDIASKSDCNGSNFDYREWVGMDGALSLNK